MKKIGFLEKTILAIISACTFASAPVSAKIDRVSSMSLGLRYSPDWIKITNVPNEIRSIPKHPDDGGGAPIELKQDSLKTHFYSLPFLMGGMQFSDSSSNNKLQLFIDYEINTSSSRVQYNYISHNTQRTIGGALIYYEVVPQNYVFSWTKLSFLERIKSPIVVRYDRHIAGFWHGVIEAKGDFCKIMLENGWDRYGYDRIRKQVKIGDIFEGVVDLSNEFHFVQEGQENGGALKLVAGLAFSKVFNQNYANLTATKIQPFFGASIAVLPR